MMILRDIGGHTWRKLPGVDTHRDAILHLQKKGGWPWRRLKLVGLDLSGADLSGMRLDRLALTCCDLSGANLAGASMRWSDLIGVNLAGADVTGVDWRGTDLRFAELDANTVGLDTARTSVFWTNGYEELLETFEELQV